MKSYSFETTEDGGSEGRVCYRGSSRSKACIWPPIVVALILATGADTSAQTKIDLKTQAKSVDFSGASSTKPSKAGTVLPATCSEGETFLKTDAIAGQNFYVCTLGNVWSLQGAVIPTVTGYANMVLATDGSALIWKALGGDVSGPPTSLTVSKLQGRPVSPAGPANAQALVWSSATLAWEPQSIGFGQISGSVTDAQVGAGINAAKIGSGTVSNASLDFLANVTSDVQTQLNGKSPTGHTHSAAGDASGALGTLTVTGLQSRPVSATAPVHGQALVWNAVASQWQPQNQDGGVTTVFGRSGAVMGQVGDYSFAQITGSVSDAQLSLGINAAKIGAGSVDNTAFGYLSNVSSDLQAQLSGKAATAHTHTIAGDVSGSSLGATTVTALQSRSVSGTAPSNGQSLVWNSGVSQWQPQFQSGGVASVFGRNGVVAAQSGDYAFSQITGAVTDSQLSTGINANKIGTGSVSSTTFGYLANVTSDLQSQIDGKLGTSQGLGGDLSGTLARANVGAIQSRSISSTPPTHGQVLTWDLGMNQWEPKSLPNLSGSYSSSFVSQTAVTIPGATHQLGTANVLVACYDNATPNMRVQPNTVGVNPISYDVTVTFVTAQSGRCVVSAGGGGAGGSGGGGGASMASQLGDFSVTWTSGAVLTVGPNCSETTPCNVRLGSNVYRYVYGSSVTLTAGTGTAYIYVDPAGVLTVGHNLTLSCNSPCRAVSGVTAFPVNAVPLYVWTATGGNWDAAGGIDKRAVLNSKVLANGAGIVTLDTGTGTIVSVDPAVVPTFLTAVASLDFGPIAMGSCAADKTFALEGAVVGDAIAPGWPGGIEAGLIGNMWVSAPNTVAVRVCNLSSGAMTPSSATYRGTVVRSF